MQGNHLLVLALSTALGTLAGCSTEVGGARDGDVEAGGSCEGFCGGQAPSGCFCDEECAANGDCCRDAEQFCTILSNEEDCEDDDHDSGDMNDNEDKVCFMGPDRDGTVCFELVSPPGTSGYNYPSPLNGNYRKPIAYIDLEAIDSSTKIAPNFSLGEIAQRHKGRYAIVQPHAVERLQKMRDQAGGLRINSGYRNPSYNASVGGASKSRHMYGDAFDIDPTAISVNSLEPICRNNGGKLVEYSSHVHCDWRNDPQDSKFFGAAASGLAGPSAFEVGFGAHIEFDGVVFTAPAKGFDEGEPARNWTAFDADGETLDTHRGEEFIAPEGTATVEVEVGRVVVAEYTL